LVWVTDVALQTLLNDKYKLESLARRWEQNEAGDPSTCSLKS